jgi:hypothetical protein
LVTSVMSLAPLKHCCGEPYNAAVFDDDRFFP